MKTLKLLFIGLSILFLSSCAQVEQKNEGGDPSAEKVEKAEAKPEVDKTPKEKTFEKMSADEASAFFGFDFEPKVHYTGSYQYYMDNEKEILHGEIKIKSKETREEFIEQYSAELGGAIEAAHFFLTTSYEGTYKEGKKDGLFKQEVEYYEAGGTYTITFEQDQCSNATYKGSGEGYCFAYDGPLKDCKFSEIETLTEEVECE